MALVDDKPADARWEATWYPVGNGELGAMVDGGVSPLTLQFNIDSLWTGDAWKTFGDYQSLGAVKFRLFRPGVMHDYRRELDLDCAEYRDSFALSEVGDEPCPVVLRRTVFASAPDKLLAIRIERDRATPCPIEAVLEGTHGEHATTNGFEGVLANGLRYCVRLDRFEELRATVFYLRAWTSFRKRPCDFGPVAESYERIRERHLADYRSLWKRMSFALKGVAGKEALLFNYGRYLLICSSRPGTLPANLQGVWNDSNTPTWHSDYHTNINLQMNYWGADAVGLSECFEPLVDWMSETRPAAEAATRAAFPGSRGFAYRTSANAFGGGSFEWNLAGAPWLATMLWEHYRYVQDREWLRDRAYPLMKGAAEFLLGRLKERKDGFLVVADGWSPEHGPREDGVTHDQQIARELFRDIASAARELGKDDDFVRQIACAERRLLRERIGRWGQLQEWVEDRDVMGDAHRHTSHLFGVFPGRTITREGTPELWAGARVSLGGRAIAGDSRRSWTWPWRAALWSRLGDNDRAEEMIALLLKHNVQPNFLTTHPPFQIDGNLGVLGAVAEILQSIYAGGKVPKAWSEGGVVRGLRIPGGKVVDFEW